MNKNFQFIDFYDFLPGIRVENIFEMRFDNKHICLLENGILFRQLKFWNFFRNYAGDIAIDLMNSAFDFLDKKYSTKNPTLSQHKKSQWIWLNPLTF